MVSTNESSKDVGEVYLLGPLSLTKVYSKIANQALELLCRTCSSDGLRQAVTIY